MQHVQQFWAAVEHSERERKQARRGGGVCGREETDSRRNVRGAVFPWSVVLACLMELDNSGFFSCVYLELNVHNRDG